MKRNRSFKYSSRFIQSREYPYLTPISPDFSPQKYIFAYLSEDLSYALIYQVGSSTPKIYNFEKKKVIFTFSQKVTIQTLIEYLKNTGFKLEQFLTYKNLLHKRLLFEKVKNRKVLDLKTFKSLRVYNYIYTSNRRNNVLHFTAEETPVRLNVGRFELHLNARFLFDYRDLDCWNQGTQRCNISQVGWNGFRYEGHPGLMMGIDLEDTISLNRDRSHYIPVHLGVTVDLFKDFKNPELEVEDFITTHKTHLKFRVKKAPYKLLNKRNRKVLIQKWYKGYHQRNIFQTMNIYSHHNKFPKYDCEIFNQDKCEAIISKSLMNNDYYNTKTQKEFFIFDFPRRKLNKVPIEK